MKRVLRGAAIAGLAAGIPTALLVAQVGRPVGSLVGIVSAPGLLAFVLSFPWIHRLHSVSPRTLFDGAGAFRSHSEYYFFPHDTRLVCSRVLATIIRCSFFSAFGGPISATNASCCCDPFPDVPLRSCRKFSTSIVTSNHALELVCFDNFPN